MRVHHDEHRAVFGGHPGSGALRARLPACGGVRARAGAGRAPSAALPKSGPTEQLDIRRMLMSMRAPPRRCALWTYVVAAMDAARSSPDPEARKQHQAFVELMIPVVKRMEYRGGAGRHLGRHPGSRRNGLHRGDRRRAVLSRRADHHHLRGHTGIQANDLIGRKTARDGGRAARAVVAEMKKAAERCRGSDELGVIEARLASARDARRSGAMGRIDFASNTDAVHAGAVPYPAL